MNKTYKEILGSIFDRWHTDLLDQGFKLTELFDKIVVWLISLSTGSIALIFSSLDKLKFVSQHTLNVTLILLVLSIGLGVIGRILTAIATYIAFFLSTQFAIQLKMFELPHNPRLISEQDTAENVYEYMLEDFKIEMPWLLEYKNTLKESEWALAHKKARDFYNDYSDASQQSLLDAMKQINKITTDSFGHPTDYFEKHKEKSNRVKGIVMRLCSNGSYLLYICSTISFGSAIVYFVISYISSTK